MRHKKRSILKNYSTALLAFLLLGAVVFVTTSCTEKSTETPAVVKATGSLADNPLLKPFDTPFGVPPFQKIKPEHFLPAYRYAMKERKKDVAAIANSEETPTFEAVIAGLDRTTILVAYIERIFRGLQVTQNNEEYNKVAQELYPLITENMDDVFMNRKLWGKIKSLNDQKDKLNLSEESDRLLYRTHAEMLRGGADLNDQDMKTLRKINEDLNLSYLKFAKNLQAESSRSKLVIDKKEDLEGLPEWVIRPAADAAENAGLKGKWVFHTSLSSMEPFLKFSAKRELREKIFKAYINRCNHDDEFDNKKIVSRIAALRAQKARMLGEENFTTYELKENMGGTPERVIEVLMKMWKKALETAKKEKAQLQELIRKEGGSFKLQPWDWWYYAEKLRKAEFDLDEESLRPYFEFENVRAGAFEVINRLYGVTFTERNDIPKYHPDVIVYEVKDEKGKHIGILYADFFARPGKLGGAWKDEFRRHEVTAAGVELTPIVSTYTNFAKPTPDNPTLLSFFEARTLFHELGHALHGLFSECMYFKLSGTAVSIDFVELPSKVMENWAKAPEVMKVYAKHYKTGEPIPGELIEKINKSALFNQGFETTEFLAASLLDIKWHSLEKIEDPDNFDVNKFEKQVMDELGLIPEIVPRYRSTYFSHLFRMNGYASGYYSYLWAEILDADAFSVFEETNLFNKKAAEAFRKHILSTGESADPMVLYKRFKGSAPNIEPLLKRRGLM